MCPKEQSLFLPPKSSYIKTKAGHVARMRVERVVDGEETGTVPPKSELTPSQQQFCSYRRKASSLGGAWRKEQSLVGYLPLWVKIRGPSPWEARRNVRAPEYGRKSKQGKTQRPSSWLSHIGKNE